MAMIIAILRLVIPLVIVIVIARLVWPLIKKYTQNPSSKIDVEAEVVNSEPLKTDYPKSETYTSSEVSNTPGKKN